MTSILVPAWRGALSTWMMPLYMGEVPIIFWLLIRGAKEGPPTAADASGGMRQGAAFG